LVESLPFFLDTHIYGFILLCMKTTIELPDELFIEAKKKAAELRVPLRKIVEQGLRAWLARPEVKKPGKRRRLRWITVDGGLPPGLDPADRETMHALLREGHE